MSRIIESPHRMLFILILALIVLPSSAWAKKEKNDGKKKKPKKAAAAEKKEAEKKEAEKKDKKKEDEKPSAPMPSATPTTTAQPATTAPTPTSSAEKPAAAGQATPPGSTVQVTRGPLKVELTLSGNLEASSMMEVSIVPKQWPQLMVVEAVAAGTRVNKGQTLLKLDTSKIDDAIRDMESTRELAELTLKQATESYMLLEKSAPLDAELVDRAKKLAEQDYEWYVKIEAPQATKSADFLLKSSEQNLEYVTEELEQLEKMYKADDLTEETEEIILKRAKNDVERAQYMTEQARLRHERTTKIDIPRNAEQQSYTLKQANLAWERSRLTLPAQWQRAKLELEKLKLEHKKADEKLTELKRDREMLTISSPVAGIVHYGRSHNGKWTTASAMAQKLRPGSQVMPYEALFTIVSEGNWTIRSSVPEKDIASVSAGVVGRLKLAAYPKNGLPVKVREVASVPTSEGTFEVALDLIGPSDQTLIAGMSGEVKLTIYLNADAITVPTKSVFSDELEEDKKYVYLVRPQGKPEKRSVETGHVKGDMTEIVSGLSAGDSILVQKPAQ